MAGIYCIYIYWRILPPPSIVRYHISEERRRKGENVEERTIDVGRAK
jgi:hypothetical protein